VPMILFIAGATLALLTLYDVVGTVVVTGTARGPLVLLRRLLGIGLPLWKRVTRKGIGAGFAPAMLLLTFIVWLSLLVLGFGLMANSVRDDFSPALQDFGDALYAAGSAMATISVGDMEVQGLARAIAVVAAFCTLSVLTLAITYLIEVQSEMANRDVTVLRMATVAGSPPSALALLERYADLDCRDALDELLHRSCEWCATVLQSHASHPSLIYFRSAATGTGWPGTLGALIDLALIAELLLDRAASRGAAVFLREQAQRLAADLCELLGLEPVEIQPPVSEAGALERRLSRAGWAVRRDADLAAFVGRRAHEQRHVVALARHLGNPTAPLLP
jgi:hypothetical protein